MIETIDLTPLIGTEVRMPRADLLSGDHADELRELLEQRGVLVFKKLGLSDAEQLQLTKTLGTPELQGGKDVMEVALDPKYHKGQEFLAEYLKGSFFWHIDGASSDRPNLASLLTARTLSQEGGQTQFANTYAAFEALPEGEQRELEKLRVVHSTETSQRYIKPEPSLAELEGWRRIGRKTHPLVWTHQSGRKSLVLGSTAAYVEGMDHFASYELLVRLRDWATQPQFVFRHDWDPGDMLIWDNTGTMHRVTPYAADSGRVMSRSVLEGEEMLV